MPHEVDFHPVGTGSKSGDAISLRYGKLDGGPNDQMVVVIDGGFADDGEALVKHIRDHYHTETVDLVISTHPEQDHLSGLKVVLEEMDVRELWMHLPWAHMTNLRLAKAAGFRYTQLGEGLEKSLSGASELEAIARSRGIPMKEPFAGLFSSDGIVGVLGPTERYYEQLLREISIPSQPTKRSALAKILELAAKAAENLHIETLTDSGETTPVNNTWVITSFQIDWDLLLFTGDAGIPALEQDVDLLERVGISPGTLSFVQVPHHGSRRNVGPSVLDRLLGPKGTTDRRGVAFVSCAPDGAPKHPAKKVTNAFRRRGYPVHATQGSGKWHHEGAPARVGWVPSTPLPLYTTVQDDA